MKGKLALTLIFVNLAVLGVWSQPPSLSTPAVEARADTLLKQLSLEEKIDLIGGVDDFYIREIKHIGWPALKMADGPLGVRNYGPSMTFGGIGLAATWDIDLAQRIGAVIGQDACARGVHFMLGPGVNIYRVPMCGSATIKHFAGNNQEYDRHNIDSIIDERTLREIYLPTFEAAVKEAHVGAIMDSNNLTNGIHLSQNGYLNIDVAKKEWGFDGIIMSDWDSSYNGVGAANGGLDLERPSGAKTLASRSDAVVVAVGFDSDSESEGGDRGFELPPAQNELIKQLAAANKNVIVVVTSGGAVDMVPWLDRAPALFQAWYPGQEGGTALAQMLFGEYSPSGRLPVSFERRWQDNGAHDSYYPRGAEKKVVYAEGLFLGYRHFEKAGIKPLFPFGFGLSYTTFAYKNLSIIPAHAAGDQTVSVSFDVTNTGHRAGAEVAEVYVGETHSSVPRPVKELKGFQKVRLDAGESRHVTVTLDRRAFAYYNVENHDWTVDGGEFSVSVGSSSEQIELTEKIPR